MVAAVEVDLVGVPESPEPFALQDSSQNIVLRLLRRPGRVEGQSQCSTILPSPSKRKIFNAPEFPCRPNSKNARV